MNRKITLVFLALLCFAMFSIVNTETTAHMRLRLHKLVEDYIAVHEAQQQNAHLIFGTQRCPDGRPVISTTMC